jgi:hypothetical protein
MQSGRPAIWLIPCGVERVRALDGRESGQVAVDRLFDHARGIDVVVP